MFTLSDKIKHDEIQEISYRNWDEFVKNETNIGFPNVNLTIYRGQRESSWKLVSPWDRWREINNSIYKNSYDDILHSFLRRFQDSAIGLPNLKTSHLSEDQWWALARHHGLITPLLDWTESPFVAAYFAFMDLAQHLSPGLFSGVVKNLRDRSEPIVIWRFMCHFTKQHPELRFLKSRTEGTHRQRAQRGLFTRLNHPDFTDLESYLKSRNEAYLLTRIEIRGADMYKAIRSLSCMNISPSTMFPDLDGAAWASNMFFLIAGHYAGFNTVPEW